MTQKTARWSKLLFRVLTVAVLVMALAAWLSVEGIVERGLNSHLAAMHQRQLAHQSTSFDRLQCRLLYGSLVTFGGLRYPEGATILDHYLHGGGRTLYLPADYIRCSPVIRHALASLRPGQTCTVRFRQQEDWRLSYAINAFQLKRQNNRVIIQQWLEFDTRPQVYTVLNMGLLRLRVPDGLIHILQPKPFMAYCMWEE